MDYQEKIKQIVGKASKDAQKIVASTMKIEDTKRWQEEHRGLKTEIINEICKQVSGIVK
ncbi:MAG: hypothetical protein L3J71_04965 [Victivallaceae bacterium]|nr:hypothetical protein [Victivallaceae bacterium]